MFAVIELQWHQYIVRENDTIVVDKLSLEGDSFVANDVLLISDEDGKDTAIWAPYIEGMGVTFSVVEAATKWEKIRVLKFKRKNRYQRVIWHRSHQTVLKVESIGKSSSTKKAPAKKEETKAEEKKEVKKTPAKKPAIAKTTPEKKTPAKKPVTKK